LESAQKRERDRKQRQRRQDKADRRRKRAEEKLLRKSTGEPTPEVPAENLRTRESDADPASPPTGA
jgi:hypothetical protein